MKLLTFLVIFLVLVMSASVAKIKEVASIKLFPPSVSIIGEQATELAIGMLIVGFGILALFIVLDHIAEKFRSKNT